MDRYMVISSDCHAGLPPEQYRDYLDPQYREAFDVALPIQIEMTKQAAKKFLVDEINEEWRQGQDEALSGAWDHDTRIGVLGFVTASGVIPTAVQPFSKVNPARFGIGVS